jgi:hypothetical protein
MKRFLPKLILMLLLWNATFAQSKLDKLMMPAPTKNKGRVILIASTFGGTYASTFTTLYKYWYSDYPQSNFHFFNDNGEWLQMDKCGHFWTANAESNLSFDALTWAGLDKKHAILYGALTGLAGQTTIEIFDGFSKEWGFSPGDETADFLGSAAFAVQQYVWDEQRIQIKFSDHLENYDYNPVLEQRARDLYGSHFPQKNLKDYNGQTYWLSTNIYSFLPDRENSNFPKWLNVAVGYGADGMFGARSNTFHINGSEEDAGSGAAYDYNNIPRYRQFYLSFDVDLTKIPTHSPILRSIFKITNCIKIPAPTIEYNPIDKLVFHPFYF